MKRILFLIFLIFVFSFPAAAEAENDIYKNQLNAAGFKEVMDNLPESTADILNDFGMDPYSADFLKELSAGNIIDCIKEFLVSGFSNCKNSLAVVLAVLILWAVFDVFSENEGSATGVNTAFTLVITLCITAPVLKIITAAASAIKASGVFMLAFVPVFGGILASNGSTTTAAGAGTMLLMASEITVQILSFLVVPLATAQLALSLSAVLSDVAPGAKIAGGIKKSANYILTFTFTVFLGLLSVQTAIGSAADTVGLKTVKFMVGSFVPVAGTALSEVVSTLGTSVKMLQSGAGVYAIVVIFAMVMPVIIELAVWRLVMAVAGIAADIMLKGKANIVLKAVDSVLAVVLGVILFIAALFIISLAILLKAGGSI